MFNLHLPLLVSTTRFSYPSNFFALFVFFSFFPLPFFSAYYSNGLSRLRFSFSWLRLLSDKTLSSLSIFPTLIFARNFYLVFKPRGSIDNKQPLYRSHVESKSGRGGFGFARYLDRSLVLHCDGERRVFFSSLPIYLFRFIPPAHFIRWQTIPANLQVSTLFPAWFMGKVRHLVAFLHFFLALYQWKVFHPCDKNVSRRARGNVCNALSHVCGPFTIIARREVGIFFLSNEFRFTNSFSHRLSRNRY